MEEEQNFVYGALVQAPTMEIAKKEFERTLIRNWIIVITDTVGLSEQLNDNYHKLPILHITMPCGETVQYKTVFDVPTETTPCTCGNPKHFFIKYDITGK